ncbi:hypothetical protein DXG01_008362 [Tephrocybe rancida]|nr:hypothetical protein DXG01_008362 [Tephrocybe rancida]
MKRGFLNTKKSTKETQEPTPARDVIGDAFEHAGAVQLGSNGPTAYKLPIGKLDTTLPENYVPKPPKVSVFDGKTVDYSDNHIIFTTIPPRTFDETSADSPDTWSECLLRGGKQKCAILNTPGFPASVPKPPQVRHRIGPSAHGMGMFATKDLVPHDLIIAERPMLALPTVMGMSVERYKPSFTPSQANQVHLAEVEECLKICLDRMLPESHAAYLTLYNCHTEDGSGPILGRARTNGIHLDIPTGSTSQDDKEPYSTSGVFDVISRINHRFDVPSFSLSLRAICPIKAGEEITITYCEIGVPKAKRQDLLRPYGFQCTCPVCSDPGSDVLLVRILENLKSKHGEPLNVVMHDSI